MDKPDQPFTTEPLKEPVTVSVEGYKARIEASFGRGKSLREVVDAIIPGWLQILGKFEAPMRKDARKFKYRTEYFEKCFEHQKGALRYQKELEEAIEVRTKWCNDYLLALQMHDDESTKQVTAYDRVIENAVQLPETVLKEQRIQRERLVVQSERFKLLREQAKVDWITVLQVLFAKRGPVNKGELLEWA